VHNITEEVKNICSVLGCIETKQVTDAVNELHLILQRKAEVNIFVHYTAIILNLNPIIN
jgi:hypothetical protein